MKADPRLDALYEAVDLLASYILNEEGYSGLGYQPIDLLELLSLLEIARGTSVKKPSKMQAKVAKVMREYSRGDLHSGSKSGPVVKSSAQAKAIAMSEGRKAAHRGKK